MMPVYQDINENASTLLGQSNNPGNLSGTDIDSVKRFMQQYTREKDLALFMKMEIFPDRAQLMMFQSGLLSLHLC